MSNEIEFFQNGHITLVNPDHQGPPAAQFLRAVRSSDLAVPGEESLGGGRVHRKEWALSRASGLITTPLFTEDGHVYFSNNTHDRKAELGEHRSPGEENSHPAKEFFFLASPSQPSEGILGGWILEGFNLVLPPLPVPDGQKPQSRFTRVNLLQPAAGAPLKFKKFRYSSGDRDFEDVSEAISKACQIYLAAGWSEADVLDRVALPAVYAASTDGHAYGYAAVVGTVQVPAAALEGVGEDGILPVPLAMNLQYDFEERLHCSLCCVVKRVDALAARSLPAGAAYPLVVSAVVEGANDDDLRGSADSASEGFLGSFKALVAEVEAGGRAGPGDDEEVAQEIARMVLEDSCGPNSSLGVYPMVWTQFATFAFVQGMEDEDDRLGKIADRVQEVIMLAAAVRAVRPLSGKPAYELYLEWSKEAVSP